MKNFQIIILIIFIVGAIFGILVFAGYINIGGKSETQTIKGQVTLWGNYTTKEVKPVLNELTKDLSYKINYVYINPENFEDRLLEAMAVGQAPDLFIINNNSLYKFLDKIYIIPYTTYPLVNYQNKFAEAGDVFLGKTGIMALPINIDPLMLYYNKDILNSYGIVYPPLYWNDFNNFNILTKKDEDNQIIQSSFALGQALNISHFKEIISNLFIQAGNNIVYLDEKDNFKIALEENKGRESLSQVMDFFISFSNPISENYSWNKSMPLSIEAFSKESLVFYFGFASDMPIISKKNPNLNFQITTIPQIKNSKDKKVYGKVEGIAISSATKNLNASLAALSFLVESNFVENIAKNRNIAPARKDLLSKPDLNDKYIPILYNSALYSKTYLDPSYKESNTIFSNMVENILSNKNKTDEAVKNTGVRIKSLL